MNKAKSNVDTNSEGPHEYESYNVLNDPWYKARLFINSNSVENALAFHVSALIITVKCFIVDPAMNKAKSKVGTKSQGPHKYDSCDVLNYPWYKARLLINSNCQWKMH